jgi:membrane-associated phospholipid phosphatase
MLARRHWNTVAAVTLAVAAILLSVNFVDRPVARLAFVISEDLAFFSRLAGTPSLFGPLAIGIAALFILRRVAFLPIAYLDGVLTQSEISILATKLLLVPLKALFGRTWPLYGDPSFIVDGAFGFYPFRGGPQYASFPSGHAASVFVLGVIFWSAYPRYRLVYGAGAATISTMLIVGDFHFVSDVIAGALLGVGVGALVAAAWNGIRRSRWVRASPHFRRQAGTGDNANV